MGAPQRLTGRVGHRAIVESIRAPKSSGRGANSSGTWIHGPIFFGGDIERTGIVVVNVSTKYVHLGRVLSKTVPSTNSGQSKNWMLHRHWSPHYNLMYGNSCEACKSCIWVQKGALKTCKYWLQIQGWSCATGKYYHLVMTNSSPWKITITIFKFGKPSISMGHGLTMANC